jgi:hypothetical protein
MSEDEREWGERGKWRMGSDSPAALATSRLGA